MTELTPWPLHCFLNYKFSKSAQRWLRHDLPVALYNGSLWRIIATWSIFLFDGKGHGSMHGCMEFGSLRSAILILTVMHTQTGPSIPCFNCIDDPSCCELSPECSSVFQDLVVRVSFILGNLTAKNDRARRKLMEQSKCVETLVNVFKHYSELDLKVSPQNNQWLHLQSTILPAFVYVTDEGREERYWLWKQVSSQQGRRCPNQGHPCAGQSVDQQEHRTCHCFQSNVHPSPPADYWSALIIINTELHVICPCFTVSIHSDNKTLENSEELVLNSMATINNLSYYHDKSSAIVNSQLSIAEC